MSRRLVGLTAPERPQFSMKISFVDIGSPRMGSSRIYGYFLSELLSRLGIVVNFNKKLEGDENIVIVGKGSDRLPSYKELSRNAHFGLINPSLARAHKYKEADFFLVGSQEEADSLAFTGKPRLFFPQIEPSIVSPPKSHEDVRVPKLVYHGNKEHLEQLSRNAKNGILGARLEKEFSIRLVYDFKRLGKADLGLGSAVSVEHVQWRRRSFQDSIRSADIGLALASAPRELQESLENALTPSQKAEFHVYAVKRLNNVGRALLMTQLGLPVIAELSPAALSLYGEPDRGFVCKSEESWTEAILSLAGSAEKRQEMASVAARFAEANFDPMRHAEKLKHALVSLSESEKPA